MTATFPANSAGPGARRSGRQRAFTLLEIMVVVGIMGLLLGIGIPAFVKVVEKQPLQQGVSDIMEALSTARAWAILRGRPAEMVLTAEGSIGVEVLEPDQNTAPSAASADGSETAEAESPPGFPRTLGSEVAVSFVGVNLVEMMDAEEVRARFYPNGTSDHLVLVMQDATGARAIEVDEITGLAEVRVLR